jgi:hypothetical protein
MLKSPAVRVVAVGLVFLLGFVACGDDDDGDATIPLSEWVGEFDQMCVEVQGKLTAETTDQEFHEINDAALAQMRALAPPDEMAETATELLNVIECGPDQNLDDATIEDLDQPALAALTSLGVSQECTGGVPG